MLDSRSRDDCTRDLEAWGRGELTTDREQDLYQEVIELYDGISKYGVVTGRSRSRAVGLMVGAACSSRGMGQAWELPGP
ncbi:hypothetical protein [Kitasatospora sp. McL0602]|uniref:hypothetical protein n=1 Tax=Kitasatospora sp. McL0602 TaxID=3439530 RepID=UPI003F8CBE63